MAKSEATATGIFRLEINDARTEAALAYAAEGDKVWTVQDIMALVQEQSVNGVKADEIGKFIEGLTKKKEKAGRLVVAKGMAPVAPLPERLVIMDLETPPALAAFIPDVLAKAHHPSVFVEVQDKVEREQTVVKKGPLPFLGGKEETVKVVEKVSRREQVAVDHTVLGHAYAEAGKVFATVSTAKPGTAGKSVSGELLPAPVVADTRFHVGEHASRKGAEITAAVSGVVRWGANWVDVVPLANHEWNIALSDDKATAFLEFTPGHAAVPAPSAADIIAKASSLGFKPEELIGTAELDALVKEAVELHQPMRHSLSQSQDAFFEIIVSDDKLKAVLNAVKGSGTGKPLVLKEIGKAINESGLKFDKDKIKADLPAWFNGPERILVGYVLAEGKAPQEAPAQPATFGATFLSGKEMETLKAEVLAGDLSSVPEFPKDKISTLAKVDKDAKVLTLGPIVNGQPGMDVYGQTIPGTPGEPFAYRICGNLDKSGQNTVAATKPGVLLKAEDQGTVWLACLEHLDAEVIVELADGAMTAYLTIHAHRGSGKPATQAVIMQEIAKTGIKMGIDTEILARLVAESEAGRDCQRVCFARGKTPEAGSPSELRWLIEFASGQGVTLRKDGTADFRNQDKITKVKKDTPLAEILPSDHLAMPGFDLSGKTLPAPAAAAIPVEIGANIRQQKEPDGRIILIADQDGEVKRDKNKVEIQSAFTFKGNIDAATGNIKFPGTVQITGDVMSGFYIMAGGEIKIAGSVEAALLTTDEDITVLGGIKGGGKAMVRTKKSVMASFIEMATVLAVGDLKIKKALVRSRVKCNGRVLLPDDGRVMGGVIKTKLGMSVGQLGAPSGIPTRVFFGQDVLIEDQIEVEEKEVAKLNEDLARLETAMKSSEKLQDKAKLQEMFIEKVRIMKLMEKRNLRLFTLKERYEQHFESEIIIKGAVHPGVVIECHGRTHEFVKPATGIRITFDTASGRIIEQPLGGAKT